MSEHDELLDDAVTARSDALIDAHRRRQSAETQAGDRVWSRVHASIVAAPAVSVGEAAGGSPTGSGISGSGTSVASAGAASAGAASAGASTLAVTTTAVVAGGSLVGAVFAFGLANSDPPETPSSAPSVATTVSKAEVTPVDPAERPAAQPEPKAEPIPEPRKMAPDTALEQRAKSPNPRRARAVEPDSAAQTRVARPQTTTQQSSPRPQPAIARQLRELRAIDRLVRAGKGPRALTRLEQFSTDHPESSFSLEVAALRILARCQRSPVASASAVAKARQWLARTPKGKFGARIRHACGLGARR